MSQQAYNIQSILIYVKWNNEKLFVFWKVDILFCIHHKHLQAYILFGLLLPTVLAKNLKKFLICIIVVNDKTKQFLIMHLVL